MVIYLKYYPVICLEGLRKTSIRISVVPAEIRTKHFPNTSIERYHYITLIHINFLISNLLYLIHVRLVVSFQLDCDIFFLVTALLYVRFGTTTQTSS
jgi:hypothetical protein